MTIDILQDIYILDIYVGCRISMGLTIDMGLWGGGGSVLVQNFLTNWEHDVKMSSLLLSQAEHPNHSPKS